MKKNIKEPFVDSKSWGSRSMDLGSRARDLSRAHNFDRASDLSRKRLFLKELLFFFVISLGLSACDKEEKPYVERPVGELYHQAYAAFKEGNLKDASDYFDEIERQHPYSAWAAKAQLMAAYASYKDQRFDHAIATLDTFIVLHPVHSEIAYAYYLRACCYYHDIGDVTKDQKNTRQALAALNEVIERFPGTPYAQDALFKRDFVFDTLAGKEMDIGRFYLKNRQYLASMNRFGEVILSYPLTTHVPEALHRLVESDVALGLRREAEKVAAVLQYNFPESPWYADSYQLLRGGDYADPPPSKKVVLPHPKRESVPPKSID